MKRIGFLATGSEIITGEILNTDSQLMAQRLQTYGMAIGEHLVVDDQEANLKAGLQFLFGRHDVVITTGGLGPTADDRTRNIIADFVGQKLVFYDPSWQWIIKRFAEREIPVAKNNKQQAYFPEQAKVLENDNGSADGCMVAHKGKMIFMLPGPPLECKPMFEQYVLPYLQDQGFGSDVTLHRWRLMGVSEAAIALELDEQVAVPYDIEIAYRASMPYIDIKVSLSHDAKADEIISKISDIVAPHFVTSEAEPISAILQRELPDLLKTPLSIQDDATHGRLQEALVSPETAELLDFTGQVSQVVLTGLTEYWDNQGEPMANLALDIHIADHAQHNTTRVPIRGEKTLEYVVEFCCSKLFNYLHSH